MHRLIEIWCASFCIVYCVEDENTHTSHSPFANNHNRFVWFRVFFILIFFYFLNQYFSFAIVESRPVRCAEYGDGIRSLCSHPRNRTTAALILAQDVRHWFARETPTVFIHSNEQTKVNTCNIDCLAHIVATRFVKKKKQEISDTRILLIRPSFRIRSPIGWITFVVRDETVPSESDKRIHFDCIDTNVPIIFSMFAA